MKRFLIVIFIGVCIGSALSGQISQSTGVSQQTSQTLRAYSDFIILQEGEEVDVNVLTNDIGVSEGVSSLEIVTQPELLSAVVVDDMSIRLTSVAGSYGSDELTYKVCLEDGDCDEAKVIIEINDFDFVPIATVDTITVIPGEMIQTDILENDRNLFDSPISIEIIYEAFYCLCQVEDDLLTVTVDESFSGKDSLQYQICDKEGDCDLAWVFFLKEETEEEAKDEVFIPQGISPNGDGLNDQFVIPYFQDETMQIKIFDVSGQLVYSNDNYQNNWDGYANKGKLAGNIVENGTYYYLLNVSSYKKAFSGYIYLIK